MDFDEVLQKVYDAQVNRDASAYRGLCDEHGIEPEDRGLYEIAQADEIMKEDVPQNVKAFLDYAKQGPNVQNMRSSLRKHFPQFGHGKKRDISRMNDHNVYGLYQGMIKSYRARYKHVLE